MIRFLVRKDEILLGVSQKNNVLLSGVGRGALLFIGCSAANCKTINAHFTI